MSNSQVLGTLFELALHRVKENFEHYCHSNKRVPSFRDLPETVAEKIRLWLFQQGKIDNRNAQLILTYTTRVLDLTGAHSKTFSVGLKILKIGASRCPRLSTLLFSGTGLLRLLNLGSFSAISKYHYLEVLDLSHSTANNNCMSMLTTSCRQLRALNVSFTNVSNVGLNHVLLGLACLEILFIRYTKITQDGIHMLLSANAPKLAVVDSEFKFPSSCCTSRVIEPASVLVSATFIKNGFVHLENRMYFFSNIYVFNHVNEHGVRDNDLVHSNFHPMNYIRTKKRHQTSFDRRDGRITFSGIESVLSKYGQNMERLKLLSLDLVDLDLVRSACPKLRVLILLFNSSYTLTPHNPPMFAYLEEINVQNNEDLAMRVPELTALLSNPSLKSISISGCRSLNTRCLIDAFSCHQFKKLETLRLHLCNSVSQYIFARVFLFPPKKSLKKVSIIDCDPFASPEAQMYISECARMQNSRMEIEFCYHATNL